jgi:hypothetical protein
MIIVVSPWGRWAVQTWDAGNSLVKYFLTPAGRTHFRGDCTGLAFQKRYARHHKMSNKVTITVNATTNTRIGGGITARLLKTNKAYMTNWTATMQAPTVRFMARSLEGRSA